MRRRAAAAAGTASSIAKSKAKVETAGKMMKVNGHQRTKSRRKTGEANDSDEAAAGLWYNRFKMEKEKHQQEREENQKKEEEIERLKLSVQNLCVYNLHATSCLPPSLFCDLFELIIPHTSVCGSNLNREKVNAFLRDDLKHSTDGNPLKSKLFP